MKDTVIRNKEFSILNFRFWIRSLGLSKGSIFDFGFRMRFQSFSGNCFLRLAIVVSLFTLFACSEELVTSSELVPTINQSPYITKIYDYQYAPGQHASLISQNDEGSSFIGEPWVNAKSFTALGGWGGYLIAGFDHAVNNTNGPDIAVYAQPSVASEPGVVFVMADNNNDGLPNDGSWFEIKGSDYNHPETIHDYQVTYYKPAISGKVTWKDNQGKSGSLVPEFGTDSWWWIGYEDQSSVTFKGVKLPDAYINTSQDSAFALWMTRAGLFKFGYAECYNNSDYNPQLKANFLDISSAVDPSGNSANLSKINFIKIQSGVFQIAGWLNEISTEVSGAADIHLLDKRSYQ